MTKYDFSMELDAPVEWLIKIGKDYENLPKYAVDQLRSVKIIESRDNGDIVTEETLRFTSIFKKDIQQKTLHKVVANNKLQAEILSGPAQGSLVVVTYDKNGGGSKVSIEIDLKLGLKYRIISLAIQKWYKQFLWGTLYKMNQEVMDEIEKMS